MSTITDIFERIAERRGWLKCDKTQYDKFDEWEHHPSEDAKAAERKTWNEIMKTLHEPFAVVTQAMDEGMEHVGLVLELLPKPKAKAKESKHSAASSDEDVEAKGDKLGPGDTGFADYLDRRIKAFYGQRGATLRKWAAAKGLSSEQFDATTASASESKEQNWGINGDGNQHRRDQQQLYLILYMEHLVSSSPNPPASAPPKLKTRLPSIIC